MNRAKTGQFIDFILIIISTLSTLVLVTKLKYIESLIILVLTVFLVGCYRYKYKFNKLR